MLRLVYVPFVKIMKEVVVAEKYGLRELEAMVEGGWNIETAIPVNNEDGKTVGSMYTLQYKRATRNQKGGS